MWRSRRKSSRLLRGGTWLKPFAASALPFPALECLDLLPIRVDARDQLPCVEPQIPFRIPPHLVRSPLEERNRADQIAIPPAGMLSIQHEAKKFLSKIHVPNSVKKNRVVVKACDNRVGRGLRNRARLFSGTRSDQGCPARFKQKGSGKVPAS